MLKVYWFRKDLRLQDNRGLKSFLDSLTSEDKFTFLYIKNKNTFNYFGEKRINFLNGCLANLKNELVSYGLDLNILCGTSLSVFKKIISKYSNVQVYANEQFEPYAIRRDNDVSQLLGGALHLFPDTTLFQKGEIVKDNGEPYFVYTPFKNKCMSIISDVHYSPAIVEFKRISGDIKNNFVKLESNILPEYTDNKFFPAGRKSAIVRLKDFYNESITSYSKDRDFPAVSGTSRLSPYIHFGLISIRECWRAAQKKVIEIPDSQDVNIWMNELLWREFYYHISYYFPYIENYSFRKKYDVLKWNTNEEHFALWCEGRTGYPIVDAAMRQLKEEGWMHNRLRMITAMFLTKDLFIDWHKGEKFFAENLIDLDFASNNGGWQWSASTGCDAQPYFRIFNPELQSKKFDPKCIFIKKYLPELSSVPEKYIHTPYLIPSDIQKSSGVIIGKDYPAPVIEHSVARDFAVSQFKNV